jgi:predicted nucleotidyltransferase
LNEFQIRDTKRFLLGWKQSLEARLAELDGALAEGSRGFCDLPDTNTGDAGRALDAIMQGVSRRYPGRAIVAYGSRVFGAADTHSDLDILVIEYDRNAAPIQETVNVNGVEVDITRVGFNVLLKGLRGRSRHNNNWFLNALRECRIYGDREGDARRLRAIAKSVWKQGPPALTPRQLRMGRGALLRLQDSTKKLVARAGDSPEAAKLARMRCDQLVAHSIYQFYCVRRRWTTSLRHLLDGCRSDYPEFHALWLEYAHSVEPEEAFDVAKHIVEAVHVDALAPQLGSPRSAPLAAHSRREEMSTRHSF